MSNQSYLFVSSKDKISGTPADFTVFINPNNHIRDHQVSLSLKRFILLNLQYGVNTTNNTLVFEENGSGTDLTTTITPGVYDSTTFATVLKTALDLVGANTYTVTYNDTTKKYTIAADGINTFKLVSGSINQVIGWPSTGMSAFVNSETGSYPINLAGTDYIDVYSNLGNQNLKSGNNLRGYLLARIPVEVGYGSMIVANTEHDATFNIINPQSLQELRIQLYDDKNELMDLPDNCTVSMKFLVELL
jgi:hypothetical protein